MELFEGAWGERFRRGAFVVVILVAVFLAVEVTAGIQGLRYIGAGLSSSNTINVSGYGEEVAVPDIATFTFSVVSEKSTVAAAQADATAKANAITAYLKQGGIEDKDIQTSNYSVYPQYDYQTAVCQANGVCPGGRSVLRGYEVRQTTTVKVRDTAKAGDLLTGVGTQGATEVSGLNFTFDDPQVVQDKAREKAITDAKDKANTLAKQLGVHLVRVVSFNENGNYPGPMPYYSKAMDATAQGMGGAAVAPEISVGENKVISNVSIVYEIR